MRRAVEVEVMGQRLTVTGDDGEDHIREVAGFVDERMRELARSAPATTLQLALVTALNIASEYRKLAAQQEEASRTINRMAQRLLARLGR